MPVMLPLALCKYSTHGQPLHSFFFAKCIHNILVFSF